MQDDTILAWTKGQLSDYRASLDPVALLHSISEGQAAITTMSSPQPLETTDGESVDQLLARLPSLWQEDETRPTHKA